MTGKTHRIRQVVALLNERELPAWAEAQKLPDVRHLIKKSRAKPARAELPLQFKKV